MSEIDKLFADAMKALHTYAGRPMSSVSIERVLFNPPATVVFWDDGVKTVVKAQNGEPFDREKGLAMAICKRLHGNRGSYFDVFKYWCRDGEGMQDDESEG